MERNVLKYSTVYIYKIYNSFSDVFFALCFCLLVLQSLKEKYGDGTTVSETCRKCGYEVDLCTAGTHESNGSIKVYAEADKFICSVCFSDNKSDQGIDYNIYYQMILTLLYYFLFIFYL